MKKKNYITPETNEILVKMEGLLAGSSIQDDNWQISDGTDEDDEM
jgi:hypothetical protein